MIDQPPRWRVRRWILRGLGITHVIAFASLGVQIRGLVGTDGILPAQELLAGIRGHFGASAWPVLPTLFWWISPSDTALAASCALGAALGLATALGFAPPLALAGAWALYLSLCSIGNVFLNYQWDALLLEATAIAIGLAPGQLRPRDAPRVRVPALAIWLLRLLVVRLFWFSGYVKLASGDPIWHSLTALGFHFFTQPLPAWTSLLAHALPPVALRAATAATLAIELVLPLAALGPRPGRLAAFAGFVALQLGIAATGNYGYFNLLTCVLCIALLDAAIWTGCALASGAPIRPPARREPQRNR
jgi:hypothetical protein